MKNPKIIYLIVALTTCFVFSAGYECTAGNKNYFQKNSNRLLWQDQVSSINDGWDWASSVATQGNRVFVAGGTPGFSVMAYDSMTGKLLWHISNADGGAAGIAAQGSLVFVAGAIDEGFAVQAFHANSGIPLWQDLVKEGLYDDMNWATSIAVKGNLIFVAGAIGDNIGCTDFAVRAYLGRTGKLLWEDLFEGTGNAMDTADAIAADRNRVFVSGTVENIYTGQDFIVRAYHAQTGKLLWQDQVNGTINQYDVGSAIAVKGNLLCVAGSLRNVGTGNDFIVRTYHAKTGKLLWQDQVNCPHEYDEANAIAIKDGLVFVGGSVSNNDKGRLFTIRAYYAKTGKLIWADQAEGSLNGWSGAEAVTVSGNRVFAAGNVSNIATFEDFTIRAYHAKTGKLLWQDQVDGTASDWDSANAIAATGGRVFVAGQVINDQTAGDLIIRTYKAH